MEKWFLFSVEKLEIETGYETPTPRFNVFDTEEDLLKYLSPIVNDYEWFKVIKGIEQKYEIILQPINSRLEKKLKSLTTNKE